MEMKKSLIILAMLCFSTLCYSQSIRMRATHVCFDDGANGTWSDWTPLDRTIYVIFDFDRDIIQITNNQKDVFEFYEITEKNANGYNTLFFYCINKDGNKCVLSFRDAPKDKMLDITITYDDFQCMYSLTK